MRHDNGTMTSSGTLTQSSGQIPVGSDRAAPSSARRRLQLVLAGLWVLDGVLKLQPFMFTKDFAPMTLGAASDGAPFWLADPINWVQKIIVNHPVGPMVVFALAELVIGFAIAYRPTVKYGLIACICWVPFLWFFAEGLGGMTAQSGPFSGAPGASILYGVLAVLLWPTERSGPGTGTGVGTGAGIGTGTGSGAGTRTGTSEATRFVGTRAAKLVWLVLWGLLAVLSFLPHNTAPDAISDTIENNVSGTPLWYTGLLNHAADWTRGRGAEVSITLGVLLVLVALSVLVNDRRVVRAGLVLSIVIAAVIWVLGEGLGMPFMGMATDPDTGPLLAVIAVVFWPVAKKLTAEATENAADDRAAAPAPTAVAGTTTTTTTSNSTTKSPSTDEEGSVA